MASAAGKPVLGKKSLSAFATTNLDEMLRQAGIGQLIIAGVATSGTVLSTTRWAVDTGYIPIRKSSAASTEMQDYWQQNPGFKVAYDQLLSGKNTTASAGSVIGENKGVRDSVRDAQNSMFLNGKAPKDALGTAAKNATSAIDDYNSRIGA